MNPIRLAESCHSAAHSTATAATAPDQSWCSAPKKVRPDGIIKMAMKGRVIIVPTWANREPNRRIHTAVVSAATKIASPSATCDPINMLASPAATAVAGMTAKAIIRWRRSAEAWERATVIAKTTERMIVSSNRCA